MNKILFPFIFLLATASLFSQSDNCAGAPALSIGASCTPLAGTSSGATQSFAGCAGTADDDVWYQFVATATSVSLQVTSSASYDAVVEVFSGTCTSPVSIACIDNTLTGGIESALVTGLTVGATYRIRVYHYYSGSGSSTFNICLTNPPAAPANNICGNAINLTVNAGCVNTAGTTYGATQSFAPCTGNSNDDVWFSFTANNYTQTIQVTPSGGMDPVVELYSGTCTTLNSLDCMDNALIGGSETINAVGLNPGTIYFVRVYDYYAGIGYPFNICVSGTPIILGSQPNDNPCSAIQLPAVTSDCNYLQFSTVGATSTSTLLAPAPASCAGGLPPAMGGYTTTTKDVWFKITVPASGKIYITPQPNMGAGTITDGVMALYSGACNALTQIACSDDYTAYPGSPNDLLPYIAATALTPGATVYLRYWGWGSGSGPFGICVQSPSNDNCSSALFICDLNGYSGSTSVAYSADRPCNMRANAEVAGTYSYTPNTNQGGIFGQGGPWGTGSPAFDVQINNNSWIKFTAAAASAAFNINIGNCWVGNYPSGGIQMQIFSAGSACCNFTPVSNFKEGSSTFTISATGLTVGNDYYLMIDGYANDICNYSINALTGVSFGNITASQSSVCPGQSTTLSGPSGATGYQWFPGGATTQTITVTPGSTITYTLIADGVCGNKQTITKTVFVKQLPSVSINSGAALGVCNTQSIALTGSGANTYTWSTGAQTASISVTPTANTTYTLRGTTNGCTNTAVSTITVNPLPALAGTPSVSPSNCGSSTGSITNISITGSPSFTYAWINGSSNTVATTANLFNQPAGTYNLFVKDSKGCTKTFGPYSITNPGAPSAPTASASTTTLCVGNTINLFASSSINTATFTWSGPNNFASGAQNPVLTPATTSMTGVYSVFATAAGCSGAATNVTVVVNANPQPNASATQTSYCAGNSIQLNASSASTYTWNGPASFTSAIQNPALTNVTPANSGNYQLSVTDANGCNGATTISVTVNPNPVLTASSSNSVVCSGALVILNANGGNVFSWLGPNGFNSSQQTPTIVASVQSSGSYSIVATNTLTGCSTGTTVALQVNNLPVFTAGANSTNVCTNSSIQLNATGNFTNAIWTGPNSYSSNGAAQSINNTTTANSGTYSVTVTDINGCQSLQTVAVSVYSLTPVNLSAGTGTFCSGNTINLFGSGAVSYTWSGPSAYQSNQQNPVISNATANSSGIYTLAVLDNNQCAHSNTVAVSVNQSPSLVNSSNALTCLGQSVTLSANFGAGVAINWYMNIGGILTAVQTNSNTYTPQLTLPGSYTFYAQGSVNNCTSAIIPVIANFYNISAGFSASPATGLAPLTVQFSNTSSGITNNDLSSWTFGDGATSLNFDPSNVYTNPGTYPVTLIISNGLCSDTAMSSIQVNPAEVEIPEVLTPNGDGKNDVFNIKNIEYFPDAELHVFNRWGHLVYTMKNYKNEWEGGANVSGKTGSGKLPTGTYFYLLNLNDTENRVYKGYCQLVY